MDTFTENLRDLSSNFRQYNTDFNEQIEIEILYIASDIEIEVRVLQNKMKEKQDIDRTKRDMQRLLVQLANVSSPNLAQRNMQDAQPVMIHKQDILTKARSLCHAVILYA